MGSNDNIVLTDENKPLLEALMRLAAFSTHRDLDAEDTLVDAIQELVRLRAENATLSERNRVLEAPWTVEYPGGGAMTPSEWPIQHLVVTHEGTRFHLYINGKLAADIRPLERAQGVIEAFNVEEEE